MYFNHGEMPWEMKEEFEPEVPEGNLELQITIEFAREQEPQGSIIEKLPEYGPMDDYLQKELERQEQERLSKMIPKRIP
jgi:hypothetical protein